jgi:hypothetical protein
MEAKKRVYGTHESLKVYLDLDTFWTWWTASAEQGLKQRCRICNDHLYPSFMTAPLFFSQHCKICNDFPHPNFQSAYYSREDLMWHLEQDHSLRPREYYLAALQHDRPDGTFFETLSRLFRGHH